MAKFCYAFACFCLACNTSNCVVRVLKISVLKFSKRLPISTRMTPLLVVLLLLVREILIVTSHKKNKIKKEKHLCNLLMHQLEVGVGKRILIISCVGSYLPSSIPHPPEAQSMLPLTFSSTMMPKCWGLKISKNNLILTLIYQLKDSSFISRISTKSIEIDRRG
jgi:hypothetical protein